MSTKQPNILLITSDQHRGDSLGCAGHPCIRTPHLDQLANEGVRFSRAYSDCPICIPARTALITGVQPHHYGSPSYNETFRIQRDHSLFLGTLLTTAGYQTTLIGKSHWHTEAHYPAGFETFVPMGRLKRERKSVLGHNAGYNGMGLNELHPTRAEFPPHYYSTNWLIDQSIEHLIDRDKSRPFFLWTSLTDPHPPICIHEPYYSMYDNDSISERVDALWREKKEPLAIALHRAFWNSNDIKDGELRKSRAVYYGMITNIDHQLARLFAQIKQMGEWDNTLILYTSDHGELLGDFRDAGKTHFLEPSSNIPLIVKPPLSWGVINGTERTMPVSLVDIFSTLCDVAGASLPSDVDGRSLKNNILELPEPGFERVFHGQIDDAHMIHDGRYKYMYWTGDGAELLFDTSSDKKDQYDLCDDTFLLKKMRSLFIEHLRLENHPDLSGDSIRNDHKKIPPRHEILRSNYRAWQGSL